MPSIPNTFPRGRMIWWRRSLCCPGIETNRITFQLSLLTKEPSIARGRSAAMTAYSESVRMSLYSRVQQDGLSDDQVKQLFSHELRAYRDALVHEVGRWHGDVTLSAMSSSDRDLKAFETLWTAFAKTGVVKAPTWTYAEEHFAELDEEEQSRLRLLVRDTPDLASTIEAETVAALGALGVLVNRTNLPMAVRVVMEARAAAARACQGAPASRTLLMNQADVTAISTPPNHATTIPATVLGAVSSGTLSSAVTAPSFPEPWCHMTPLEVAERTISDTPRMFAHRAGGKRARAQTGEQTLRQIRWAATLLEKSLPPGTPYCRVTYNDIREFDKWLDKLPVSFGKSTRDRLPNTSLGDVVDRAVEKVVDGEIEADQIGLAPPTSNKHYRKLAQIHTFLRKKIPDLAEIAFSEFLQPDLKDERSARLRYSLEQGVAIFSLPPWTGCRWIEDRLTPGKLIFHDSLYFVLLLVWYTGARREEICKLRLKDVDCQKGIWFLRIENTETGRVKNISSERCVPIADELIRLGFIKYVQALIDAGETLLFPDIAPADASKRKRGDVFYKIWWMYLKPMIPGLIRGQAMHAARHSVSDELKQQAVFVEFRNDLLGHQNKGGDGATRYPSATKLSTLRDLVNCIPIVTEHLLREPDDPIALLPAENRKPRPARANAK